MRSVLGRRYKFSHPPVAALSEGDFLSGWWKWRSSCKGGRNRSKERLEWLEKASNPRQLYFVKNDGNVHFLLSSIVEYILPHISTSCFLVTQDLKDLCWAKMMCISVSVISLNSGRSLGETYARLWYNVQYQYMQIWYQCKTGRSWGYVATGHHKTKRDIAWYSTQQDLSWSGILIHTTTFELLQTFAACVWTVLSHPQAPESAWSFLSVEAPGGTHPTSHWRCRTTQILHRHVHWAGCIPRITYCRVPDERLSGCARHSENSNFSMWQASKYTSWNQTKG